MLTCAMMSSLCHKESILGLRNIRLSVSIFNSLRGPVYISTSARNFVSHQTRKAELAPSRFGASAHVNRSTEHCFQQNNISNIYKSFAHGFRTSAPKNIHPILLALIKPMARLLPMVLGRKFRRWWKGLSDSDKIEFKNAKKKYRHILGGEFYLLT